MKDRSHDLLGMLSCVRRLFSWPRRFLQSSSFFPEKLQFDINSRRFLSFLYVIIVSPQSQLDLDFDLGLLWGWVWVYGNFGLGTRARV